MENMFPQQKEMGVKDVAFYKKRGIAIECIVKSKWVYKKLRNFRVGVGANISVLKRTYGEWIDICGKAGSILILTI